jgi:hypothetical protein
VVTTVYVEDFPDEDAFNLDTAIETTDYTDYE